MVGNEAPKGGRGSIPRGRRTQTGEDFARNGSHNMYRKALSWEGHALVPVTLNQTPPAALRRAS